MSPAPVIIITGPTATGKTELSIALARLFTAPVISADARQCYKYLDIGTAKVSEAILEEIPHYHISTLYPDETFTAADFAASATEWIDDIRKTGKPAIISGGSTLYIESLIRPFDPVPPRNEENIRKLESESEKHGLEYIEQKLKKIDPEYAARVDGPNRHRMFRALDVWMQTGKPFSSFHKNHDLDMPDNSFLYCLYRDRPELHERINHRVDTMLEQGLVDEVRSILDMGYTPGLQSLQTVGYREVIEYLKDNTTEAQMTEAIKTNTRRYARRQITWFRRWKDSARWINQSHNSTDDIIHYILEDIHKLEADS